MRAGDKMLFQEHDLDGNEDVSQRQNVQVFGFYFVYLSSNSN